METKNTQVLGVIITMILVVGLGSYLIATAEETEYLPEEYQPQSPAAQESYNLARFKLCEAEVNLAATKILDVANNVNIEADLNDLNNKKQTNCADF